MNTTTIILLLLPIFAFFAIGLLLKVAGMAERSHGDFLLHLQFESKQSPFLQIGSRAYPAAHSPKRPRDQWTNPAAVVPDSSPKRSIFKNV